MTYFAEIFLFYFSFLKINRVIFYIFIVFCLFLQDSSSSSDVFKESVSNEQSSENVSSEDPMDKPDVPRAVKNWPQEPLKLGQVSGVSVNSALQPVIFHRGDRVWDY